MGISKIRKAAKNLLLALLHPPSSRGSTAITKQDTCSLSHHHDEAIDKPDSTTNIPHPTSTQLVLCSICLEPLNHCDDTYSSKPIFTGQCSHSFHFSCIASNVRHGNVTCPVCRAHWTYLPIPSLSGHQLDNPVFHVLDDDSIAISRVHRRLILSSARYNDDDPIDIPHSTSYPRLAFSLIPLTVAPNLVSYPCSFLHQSAYSPLQMCRTGFDTNHNHLTSRFSPSALPQPEDCPCFFTSLVNRKAYLSVKLSNLQPVDLVLVVSPTGPHVQLLKQAMTLVAFSLRPVDRLAIVTYSCVATRVLALRRMTSCGKREALQVIDQMFYIGETDPSQGILKGIKVLKDRTYKNPQCSILHISSSPVRSYYPTSVMQMGVMVHKFQVGFGAETWNGFVMHKFEEFLDKVLRGVASDIKLRIETSVARSCLKGKIVKVGELRGSEERQVLLDLGVNVSFRLCYSYVKGDTDECIRRRGETTLRF